MCSLIILTATYKFVDTGKLYNINRKDLVMPMFILYGGGERVQAPLTS